MSFYGRDTASTLGVLDQTAAPEERAFGAGLLRRQAQQANLLQDYPSIMGAFALPVDGADSDGDVTRFEVLLSLLGSQIVTIWTGPWWPAHTAYEARLRVRITSGVDVRLGFERDDLSTTVSGTGAWQTVTLTGTIDEPSRERTWALWARQDAGPTAAASGVIASGVRTNPLTWTSSDRISSAFAVIDGVTFDSSLDQGGYAVVSSDNWARDIRHTGALADALFFSPLLEDYQVAQTVPGRTFTIVERMRMELGSITLVGGEP